MADKESREINLKTLSILKDSRILIIEDDRLTNLALCQGISPFCQRVYTSSDAESGYDIYKQHLIDIIICDINLPKISGFDLIEQILAINPNQRFIIITSYDSDDNMLQSIKQGAFAYMRKPIKIIELQTFLIQLSLQNKALNICLDDLQIDMKTKKILRNGVEVALPYRLSRIFWLLVFNKNSIVKYESIIEYSYDEEVSYDAVRMAIGRIKKLLNITPYIQSIAGAGYMLVTNISSKNQ